MIGPRLRVIGLHMSFKTYSERTQNTGLISKNPYGRRGLHCTPISARPCQKSPILSHSTLYVELSLSIRKSPDHKQSPHTAHKDHGPCYNAGQDRRTAHISYETVASAYTLKKGGAAMLPAPYAMLLTTMQQTMIPLRLLQSVPSPLVPFHASSGPRRFRSAPAAAT